MPLIFSNVQGHHSVMPVHFAYIKRIIVSRLLKSVPHDWWQAKSSQCPCSTSRMSLRPFIFWLIECRPRSVVRFGERDSVHTGYHTSHLKRVFISIGQNCYRIDLQNLSLSLDYCITKLLQKSTFVLKHWHIRTGASISLELFIVSINAYFWVFLSWLFLTPWETISSHENGVWVFINVHTVFK